MIQNFQSFGYLSDNRKQYFNSIRANKIGFKGMSQPSQYKTSFDYLSAQILNNSIKKYPPLDASMISATKIKEAIAKLFMMNRIFGPYKESNPQKIAWKAYIPQDIRVYCTDKINEARAARLKQWQNFLENPETIVDKDSELAKNIREDDSLKFVIWSAVNSELQPSNRHIPVPFNVKALDETVRYFKTVDPMFRAITFQQTTFLKVYTHRLRDNVLMDKGLSDNRAVWVKIPSVKKDPTNKEQNIAELEILSNKNWCTRSSLDKAEAALEDGDFYVYLERDDKNLWHSMLGMTTLRGQVDQIQGRENNNFIPLGQVENIKNFLKKNNLKCVSGVRDEGPKALQQLLVADKLAELNPVVDKTLTNAIKEKDCYSIFKILGKAVEASEDGFLTIDTYKPTCLLDSKSGITIPYTYMGIDEDALLSKVDVIDGDLFLYNRNPVFNSYITKFPENLKSVKGRILCTKEQFEKFKDDMLRVVANKSQISVY